MLPLVFLQFVPCACAVPLYLVCAEPAAVAQPLALPRARVIQKTELKLRTVPYLPPAECGICLLAVGSCQRKYRECCPGRKRIPSRLPDAGLPRAGERRSGNSDETRTSQESLD